MEPKQIKCLLIEDDQDDIDIFKIALEELATHTEIVSYTNCEQAVKDLVQKDFQPDYIFVDSHLLRTRAEDCLQKLNSINQVLSVPIVLLTTKGTLIDEGSLKAHGITEVIFKEDSIGKLKDSLRAFFSQKAYLE